MAHGYHTLQHWDQWLTQKFLGQCLIEAEQEILSQLLKRHYGKHALLLGVPHQLDLLNTTQIPFTNLISPLITREINHHLIEGDYHELPILTGSVDLVLLPHTLEFVDNPRQVLTEACRIIKPEGVIVICGFNPLSFWGLIKSFKHQKMIPWSKHIIHTNKVKQWLELADFKIEQHTSTLFRPPLKNKNLFDRLHFLEKIGSKCFSRLGSSYILLARAKVVPLTPIRMKWKQQLSGLRISTSISGHIARHSK